MQQIKVDTIGVHPLQAALASLDRALAAGIMGIDLADQEHLVTPSLDGPADDFLRTAVGIHLGGIEQRHAEIETGLQAGDLVLGAGGILSHIPCALAERRNRDAGGKGTVGMGSCMACPRCEPEQG